MTSHLSSNDCVPEKSFLMLFENTNKVQTSQLHFFSSALPQFTVSSFYLEAWNFELLQNVLAITTTRQIAQLSGSS